MNPGTHSGAVVSKAAPEGRKISRKLRTTRKPSILAHRGEPGRVNPSRLAKVLTLRPKGRRIFKEIEICVDIGYHFGIILGGLGATLVEKTPIETGLDLDDFRVGDPG